MVSLHILEAFIGINRGRMNVVLIIQVRAIHSKLALKFLVEIRLI